ncbi:hypothetical protein D3C85_1656600 [compost metagenome]
MQDQVVVNRHGQLDAFTQRRERRIDFHYQAAIGSSGVCSRRLLDHLGAFEGKNGLAVTRIRTVHRLFLLDGLTAQWQACSIMNDGQQRIPCLDQFEGFCQCQLKIVVCDPGGTF